MRKRWTSQILVVATVTIFALTSAQSAAAGGQWPVARHDRSSIIIVLEPAPSIPDGAAVVTLSAGAALIDAAPWHASQPFVKQYLLDPGQYVVGSADDTGLAKLAIQPGKATILKLSVEETPGKEPNYNLTVTTAPDGWNLDLDEAQSRLVESLDQFKGTPQLYLSNLRTEDEALLFGVEPLSEYAPRIPWPVPKPAPNPEPTDPKDQLR